MTLEDSVHAFRLQIFRRAEELGNVSQACEELGVSRSFYYQLRQRFLRYGADGLRVCVEWVPDVQENLGQEHLRGLDRG